MSDYITADDIYTFPINKDLKEFYYDITLLHIDSEYNLFISLLKNVSSQEYILTFCKIHNTTKLHSYENNSPIEWISLIFTLKNLQLNDITLSNICNQIKDKYPEFLY